ncbi:MAG: hypothetical protein CVU88_06185 [Firmicutes bacterium HGW-Firmicutes-13]|nr:MAG: hypothetical protein CVU88_06185 [Firmicutes bacterium HGW-Firmicutes-13]
MIYLKNHKNKIALMFIFCLIISSLFIPAAAAQTSDEDIPVFLDGKQLEFDVPSRIENGRTLVPLRVIFEALGAVVQWNTQTRTVTAHREQVTVTLRIENKNAYRNNELVELEAPPVINNGRTLVPLRFVSEAFGAFVDWDKNTRTVTIKSPEEKKDVIDTDRGYPHSVTPIVGEPLITLSQARIWAVYRGAHPDFIEIAELYWEIGTELGIRPEVAYAQSAKETNFGKFTGVVSREFNNWCGLKIFEGGPCDEPDSHARFPNDRTGVTAHYHHLMTYAGVRIEGESLSPRSSLVQFGCAPYVENLGGRWALASTYGKSIVWDYLVPMQKVFD